VARWYIEAKEGESWRQVSRQFGGWLPDSAGLRDFGWHEGDPVSVDKRKLYCFDFPDRYGEKIALFEAWAKTTGRLYGEAKGGTLHFPADPSLTVALPPEPSSPVPSWLR